MTTTLAMPPDGRPQGASIVETKSFLLAETALLDIRRKSRMGAFVGTAGTGKTFAIKELTDDLEGIRIVWLEFESRPTILHLARMIYQGLFGEEAKGNRNKISAAIIDGLRRDNNDEDLMLVVDEAQRLNTECIEYLRYLHDHVGTGFSLAILGGDGAWAVIREEPMLISRIYRRVTFEPILDDEIVDTIKNYHEIYESVEDDLILDINEYCKGVFRWWASITETLVDLMADADETKLTRDTVEAGLELVFEG